MYYIKNFIDSTTVSILSVLIAIYAVKFLILGVSYLPDFIHFLILGGV